MVCFVVSVALSEYENFLQMTPYRYPSVSGTFRPLVSSRERYNRIELVLYLKTLFLFLNTGTGMIFSKIHATGAPTHQPY
jgi:hypothetical protein